MKITFFDSVRETFESCDNVMAMSVEWFKNRRGRYQRYYFVTLRNGTHIQYECNRYTIKRLRED